MDFDHIIDRRKTNALKWDANERIFGQEHVLPLWVGDMDLPVPDEVVAAIKKRADHPIFGYPAQTDELYQSVASWIERRYHVQVDPTTFFAIAGVMTGIHVAIDAFSEPDDEVVIQPPVYYPFRHAVLHRGRKLVQNPLRRREDGRYEMDLVDLEQKITSRTRLLILCNPHNPVGRVWTREELEALGDLARKHQLIILSDEIHGDIVYPGHSFVPFYALPPALAERSLSFLAASKTFNLPGLKTSFVISRNPDLQHQFARTANNLLLGGVNLFGMEASQAAYRYGDAWLEELLAYLWGNVTYIKSFLEEHLPDVAFTLPEATFFAWLDFRAWEMDDQELKRFMIEEAGLGLNDGYIFGDQGSGFQRLNFGCSRQVIQQAMEQLARAYQRRKSR